MSTSLPVLWALPHSPWSERARWALDYCRVPYVERAYVPRVGEWPMRLRTGRWSDRITVPILQTDSTTLHDGHEIARWADERGSADLFPEGEQGIARWHALSDRMLAAGRRRTSRGVIGDAVALRASMEMGAPFARWLPLSIGRSSTEWLLNKYADLQEDTADEVILAEGMAELATALEGRDTLLDRFSIADVHMAVALQFVQPPTHMEPHIPEPSRHHWCVPELVDRHLELLAWRDRVVDRFR